jgi:hypothetical protein
MAFGTEFGRALVLYAILPFGGAFVIIKAVEHVVYGHAPPAPLDDGSVAVEQATLRDALLQAGWVICVGILLLGLLHVPWFRGAVTGLVRAVGRMLRRVFVEIPRQLMDLAIVREVMRSVPVTMFVRHLLNPLLLTLFFCWALPALGWYRYPSRSLFLGVWMAIVVLLNSRVGRDIEEVAAERIERTWHRIRIHFFVALFDLIMDTFKWILELVERVLYSVDEWLRFKSGESDLMLGSKRHWESWVAATFVIRFCDIAHRAASQPDQALSVVTVSHRFCCRSRSIWRNCSNL